MRTLRIGCVAIALGVGLAAQGERMASPPGASSTEIRGRYEKTVGGPAYTGGKWIEIVYGRPIKRGRDLWGENAEYGRMLSSGAPVWRAGANVSTRLRTELPLVMAGKTIAPGEYSLFVDLKPDNWTLIVSGWAAQQAEEPGNKNALWGSFGYTPAKDVARSPMALRTLPFSMDELTWNFVDMSDKGGKIALMWDKVAATAPFTVAP